MGAKTKRLKPMLKEHRHLRPCIKPPFFSFFLFFFYVHSTISPICFWATVSSPPGHSSTTYAIRVLDYIGVAWFTTTRSSEIIKIATQIGVEHHNETIVNDLFNSRKDTNVLSPEQELCQNSTRVLDPCNFRDHRDKKVSSKILNFWLGYIYIFNICVPSPKHHRPKMTGYVVLLTSSARRSLL